MNMFHFSHPASPRYVSIGRASLIFTSKPRKWSRLRKYGQPCNSITVMARLQLDGRWFGFRLSTGRATLCRGSTQEPSRPSCPVVTRFSTPPPVAKVVERAANHPFPCSTGGLKTGATPPPACMPFLIKGKFVPVQATTAQRGEERYSSTHS